MLLTKKRREKNVYQKKKFYIFMFTIVQGCGICQDGKNNALVRVCAGMSK